MSENWRDKSAGNKYWRGGRGGNSWRGGRGGGGRGGYGKRRPMLEPGVKGFLCTCNSKFQEKECMWDAFRLLNEYADEHFGKETFGKTTTEKPEEATPAEDIDASLEDELAALKDQNAVSHEERRFQSLDSNLNATVFIKTTLENVVEIARGVVSKIAEEKVQKAKFLLRILPVEITCRVSMEEIDKAADELLPKYFSGEPKTYSIVFNHKCNDQLSRDQLIDLLGAKVIALNPGHKVDLKNAELAIFVEALKNVCCFSVVPDYFAFKKYNIMELCLKKEEEAIDASPKKVKTEEQAIDTEGADKPSSASE